MEKGEREKGEERKDNLDFFFQRSVSVVALTRLYVAMPLSMNIKGQRELFNLYGEETTVFLILVVLYSYFSFPPNPLPQNLLLLVVLF